MIDNQNDKYTFRVVSVNDKEEIMNMYKKAIGSAGCTWSEEYPSTKTFDMDVAAENIFCMVEKQTGIIAGAVSIDQDPEVDGLPCWSSNIGKMAEISRLVVKDEYQNNGLAKEMVNQLIEVLKQREYKSVHYLVNKYHKKALAAYKKLEFTLVGECDILEHEWYCYEKMI